MKPYWVCQLPQEQQDDIRWRLTNGLIDEGLYTSAQIAEAVDEAMDDKLDAVMDVLHEMEGDNEQQDDEAGV